MKHFNVLKMFALAILVAVAFTACDENSDNPVDTDPAVAAPTNLMAASDDGAVFLSWTPSIDESATNFGSYSITILNTSTNQTGTPITAGAGISSVRIDGLTNGVIYTFTIRSLTDQGKESTGFAQIDWSPAVRNAVDNGGNLIRVYATTSATEPSAIDLYNDNGMTEVISQAGQEFQDRGDLYVYAASDTDVLKLMSPAEANNQGMETQFSSQASVATDDLDDQLATEAPAASSYTLSEIMPDNGQVSAGQVYWGRLVRGSDYFYFRLLVKKGSNGRLVQGTGNDRYFEMVVSFQNAPNNKFAKH
ncbi:fibronectin type III domain-containing protein [bacterium]|nr:fibronectin type III domain-containing protein [bacterium]